MARTRTRLVTPRSCLGTLALLVVAVPVALWLVYLRNNAPPNVAIPTPVMPANNAYNDFLRAAQMAGTIKHKAPASMNNPPTTRAAYLAE